MQDLNDKITGNTLTAAEWNEPPSEIQNVIENTGQTLSSGDLNQLGKGIAMYASNGDAYTDTGIADAYVLSVIGSKQAPPDLVNLMKFRFTPGNDCTGACTANPAGLGVTNIKLAGGTVNPVAGDISTSADCELVYKTSPSTHLELTNPQVSGGPPTVQIFTSNGTYNKPAGLKKAIVEVIGAGGAGGGASTTGVGEASSGSGGGGGGYSREMLSASAIGSSESVTIGAGGTGVVGGNGNDGASSSFGSLLSATGGTGGLRELASAVLSGTEGSIGGNGVGGDVNVRGSGGTFSFQQGTTDVTNPVGYSGAGGNSVLGGGAPSEKATTTKTGVDGGDYGGGGSGGANAESQTQVAGGDGADGLIIVTEFY